MSVRDAQAERPAVARARAALFVYFAIMGVGIGYWAANIPAVQQRTGVDTGTLGIALFLIAAGAVSATPPISWLVRRQGSRLWTTVGSVGFALAVSLPVLASTPEALMAGAFCLGLCIGATDVPLNVHAVEVETAWGRPTMSAFHGFYSLGGAAGAILGGILGGNGSWIATITVCVLLATAAIAANGFLLGSDANSGADRPPWRLNRAAALIGLLAALCFGIEGAIVDWSALYLAEIKGLTLSAASAGPAFFMLTMALARFLGDIVVERIGRPATLALSGAGITTGIAMAVLAPNGIASAVGFGLVGITAANIIPILFSEAGRVRGIAPEAAIAAVAVIGYAGFLLSPPLFGAIAHASSLSAGFVLAGAGGLIFVAAGLLRHRRGG